MSRPRRDLREPSSQQDKKSKVFDLLFGSVGPSLKKKKEEKKENWFIRLCRFTGKQMGKSAKKELTPDYEVALAFLGWKLTPEEVNSAPVFVAYVGMGLAFFWAILNFVAQNFLPSLIPFGDSFIIGQDALLIGHPLVAGPGIIWYVAPFAIAFYAMYYVQSFPMKAAEKQKIVALTFIPELVNYLVMSMKVNPNLERAIDFAAEHGHGRISEDFQELRYDIHIGKFKTVEEAMDHLAWKWGKYSEEFKLALMMIRSSVIEADETKRNDVLDKAMTDVLAGIQEKMDFYSRRMHQPSIYLYYFGVLLPLLLIIIIPVGSMMGGGGIAFLSSTFAMVAIYNFLIPGMSFLLAKSILAKRPPTRPVPDIPTDLPGLPKLGWFKIGGYELPVKAVVAAIFVFAVVGGFVANGVLNAPSPCYTAECHGFLFSILDLGVDAEPGPNIVFASSSYLPVLAFAGVLIGLTSGAGFYLWSNYKDRRKVQMEIVKMEEEFQDSLYVLASRLAEGRPMEDALKYTAEFLPDSRATKMIFIPTLQNLVMMGMTLKTALFDEAYGSLRYIPSEFIHGTMRIVVDSLDLGVQTAAKSLISLSMQIHDMQKVEKALKSMLEDITTMMSTMAIFIAPVVLGITIALQQIIMGALTSMAEAGLGDTGGAPTGASGFAGGGGLGGMSLPSIGDPAVLEAAASQGELLVIISVYMIEIVIVLMYFASHVNEGDNELGFKMALASSLPLAMIIFFTVTFVAMKVTSIGL